MTKKKVILIIVLLIMVLSTVGIYVYKNQQPAYGTAEVKSL